MAREKISAQVNHQLFSLGIKLVKFCTNKWDFHFSCRRIFNFSKELQRSWWGRNLYVCLGVPEKWRKTSWDVHGWIHVWVLLCSWQSRRGIFGLSILFLRKCFFMYQGRPGQLFIWCITGLFLAGIWGYLIFLLIPVSKAWAWDITPDCSIP